MFIGLIVFRVVLLVSIFSSCCVGDTTPLQQQQQKLPLKCWLLNMSILSIFYCFFFSLLFQMNYVPTIFNFIKTISSQIGRKCIGGKCVNSTNLFSVGTL